MGLEASVMCTCYAEGKTTPCPFPDRFFINEAGFPDLRPDPDADPERDLEAFVNWLQHACAHPGMQAARVYVSNWADYNAFINALETSAPEKFPTLLRELPDDNGGLMPASAAPAALRELAAFERMEEVGSNIFVVDGGTGDKLYAYVPDYGGIFIWDGRHGHNVGVDEDGLFIVDVWELSRVVFRSRRCEQHLHEAHLTESGGDGRVEYIDLDSGRRFECKTAIPGKEIPWPDGRMRNDEGRFRLEYPRLLLVEELALTPAYFENIVAALRRAFEAAQDTGNPVRWF